MKCRHCNNILKNTLIDLGCSPLSNGYLKKNELLKPEIYYPLIIKVCNKCWLVQTVDYAKKEKIFDEKYAYFSSTSLSWLRHAENYTNKIIKKLNINSSSFVIEIASNDGYLLKNFIKLNIPCLGIEPTKSTAQSAEKKGIKVLQTFFTEKIGIKLASENIKSDLIIANNVLAHVPDINDFCAGLKHILKDEGTITIEFPHVKKLLEKVQFDTIYHEHFSYLSIISISKVFKLAGLRIWDVEKISTHGGSLRVYVCHIRSTRIEKNRVAILINEELKFGMNKIETYQDFEKRACIIKNNFISKLILLKNKKMKVVGFGAAAKGNTFLNFAGIGRDLIPVIFDGTVAKQNKYTPGSRIPILSSKLIDKSNPDCVVIFAWNLSNEIKTEVNLKLKYPVKFILPLN